MMPNQIKFQYHQLHHQHRRPKHPNFQYVYITDYGIDAQQDYLNGDATGSPTNGVNITGMSFMDVTSTATGTGYYLFFASSSRSNSTFTGVSINEGSETSTCNSQLRIVLLRSGWAVGAKSKFLYINLNA